MLKIILLSNNTDGSFCTKFQEILCVEREYGRLKLIDKFQNFNHFIHVLQLFYFLIVQLSVSVLPSSKQRQCQNLISWGSSSSFTSSLFSLSVISLSISWTSSARLLFQDMSAIRHQMCQKRDIFITLS